MKTADDIVKNYKGAFPDVHGRTPWKTWDELAECMRSDIETYASLRASEAIREKEEELRAFTALTDKHIAEQDQLIYDQSKEIEQLKAPMRDLLNWMLDNDYIKLVLIKTGDDKKHFRNWKTPDVLINEWASHRTENTTEPFTGPVVEEEDDTPFNNTR